jgi:hypothetical protein
MLLAALYMLSFLEQDEDDHSPSENSIQISLSLSLEIKISGAARNMAHHTTRHEQSIYMT